MKFPFAVSRTITLNQPERTITSESYLLNHIEEQLSHLDMEVSRIDDNIIMFEKNDFFRGIRTKDFLQHLKIEVSSSKLVIKIRLESNMILQLVLLIIPLFVFIVAGTLSPELLFLVIGFIALAYFQKYIILLQIRKNLFKYFRSEFNS